MDINSLKIRKLMFKINGYLFPFLLVLWQCTLALAVNAATNPPADPILLEKAYGMAETLNYEVSWMGLKAGKLVIQLIPDPNGEDSFEIRVTAKSEGLLDVLYPVEDNFKTIVTGAERLPIRYSIDLHEGRRRNKKLTIYDQQKGILNYTKNNAQPKIFKISGPTYNEFSSFMIMRALPLVIGEEVMVPTFADYKRHEVMVKVEGKDKLSCIFGEIDTIRVRPQLPFKGLYQKTGAPVIWLSDNEARIPVKIKAKIKIGSITAKLVAYQGWKEICRQPAKVHSAEEPFL